MRNEIVVSNAAIIVVLPHPSFSIQKAKGIAAI